MRTTLTKQGLYISLRHRFFNSIIQNREFNSNTTRNIVGSSDNKKTLLPQKFFKQNYQCLSNSQKT